MEKKHIILVDDHVVVRDGLKALIEKIGPYQIKEQFDNGANLVNSWPFNTKPDLIIMDLTMPIMDGDEALGKLNDAGCEVPVLILTLNSDDERMLKLFRLGARGYLLKNCTANTMKEALDEIFRCGYYHNEFLTYSLRNESKPKKQSEQEIVLDQLSLREREFLKLVCHEDEYTYEQIAGIMNVQHRTVDGYRESIFEKFSIKSKTGLVLFILKHQLFNLL